MDSIHLVINNGGDKLTLIATDYGLRVLVYEDYETALAMNHLNDKQVQELTEVLQKYLKDKNG